MIHLQIVSKCRDVVLTVLNQKGDARNSIHMSAQGLIVVLGDAMERDWISRFPEKLSPFQAKEYKRYYNVSLLSTKRSALF